MYQTSGEKTKEPLAKTCAHCLVDGANTYTLSGAVWADLCPRCRTDVHTYITTELPFSEFREKSIAAKTASSPTDFISLDRDFLDMELEMHKAVKEWVYGPGTSTAK